jgi:DNA invertase Pin-like site-specific DNA recombinase
VKVDVICLKEPINTTTPAGKMVMTVFAAMYEMEWASIQQREGIHIALAKGVRFGRPRVEPPNFEKVYQRWRTGKISAVEAMSTGLLFQVTGKGFVVLDAEPALR